MSELRNQRQVQQQSCEVTTTFCQREAGRVNVGFPPPTRHHLWEKKLLQLEVYASTLISHKGGWNWRRRKKKHVPLLTDTSETLGQSSPQLFHFADFLRGLGGWHQVAHVFFDLHTDFGGGLAADGLCVGSGERRTGVPSALRGLLQPSCSALANRKRSPSRLSLLSSTSAAKMPP